uniref:Tudor domain-containing protein Tdr1 n=1 Tax=Locusta migratoria TaxID=7004 RepID=A0AAU7J909_LOCMI
MAKNVRELDDWDPMAHDFTDGTFNTYVDGPGSRMDHSQQPWARHSSKGPFKVYVGNVPLGISKEGITNIFSNYGDVLSVYLREPVPGQHVTWAFIVFPKHSQAERAIRELNNKKPLFLKVQFAMSDSEKQRLRLESEKAAIWGTVSESLADSDDLTELPARRKSDIGHGRGKLRQVFMTPPVGYRGGRFNDDYSDEECSGYRAGGQFDEVNGVVLKGIHCSLQSGGSNRTVSKGRGFYSVSADRPGVKRQSLLRTPEHVDNSSDDTDVENTVRRQSGKYVFGDPVHLRARACRACLACGRLTTSVCARCGDFYCSEECQRNDWPNHKPNCVPPPGIVNTATGLSPNQTLPLHTPLSISENKDSHRFIEQRRHTKEMIKATQSPLLPVNNNCRSSTPQNAHDVNSSLDSNLTQKSDTKHEVQPDEERVVSNTEVLQKSQPLLKNNETRDYGKKLDTKPLLQHGENVLGSGDTKEQRLGGAEVSPKPQKLVNDNTGKQNTLHDQIQNSYTQNETFKPSGNQKRNPRGNRTNTSPAFGDNNRTPNNENRRGNYAQNESSWKSNEPGRNRNSYGPNDTARRNDPGNRKQGGDKSGDRNKSQNRNNQQRHFKANTQNRDVENPTKAIDKKPLIHQQPKAADKQQLNSTDDWQSKSTDDWQSKSADENLAQSVKEQLTITGSSQSSVKCTATAERSPDSKKEHGLAKEEIHSDSYTKVKVVLKLDSTQYMVQKSENDEKIMELLQSLQNINNNDHFTPEVGKLCVASYEGIWYRAEIMKVVPEIRVFYVDYGNEETCTAETLRILPKEASELPAQAIKIKLAEGTSKKFENLSEDSEIMVKSFKKDNSGVTIVMVEGENYSLLEQPSKQNVTNIKDNASKAVCSENSIISLLPSGTEAVMSVRGIENANQFTGTLLAETCVDIYKKLFEDLCDTEVPHENGFKPAVGELVVAQLPADSLWYRAKVLSVLQNGYRVAFCDIGISQKVEKVRRIPEGFVDLKQMSVRCEIVKYFTDDSEVWRKYIKIGGNLKMTVVGAYPEKVIADVVDNVVICTVEVKKWDPIPEDKGVNIVEIENNSGVILLTFCSPRTMYVRPSAKNMQEKFNRILQDVAGHAFKAPSMGRLPIKGEIVACKYSKDNNYYRAEVIGFEKDKVVVTYLDFGNTEQEDITHVKELSEELKSVPACAIKIHLKDVPDLPFNTQIVEFLGEVTLKETELKLKYSDFKEGVDLFMDGTHINAKIKSLLEPSWQQPKKTDASPLYFYENLKFVDLAVGEEISMAICHVQPPDIVFGFKEGSDIMQYVMTVMQEKVDDYCNNVDKESFLPRKLEMCLAEYEGAWYRAACLDVERNLVSVIFVDYGNTEEVSFKKIRKMPRDFMDTPVAVLACTVKDFPMNETLQELVNKVKKVKVLSVAKQGHCEVKIIQ